MATRSRLTIRWISGHSKVKGNEDVDKLAKDAAAGRSSPMASLPHILRSPIPRSASALKQEFNSGLKARWAATWAASPRMPRVAQFGDAFPFGAFLKRLHLLTRKQSSHILQIRCGHFPLNAYLFKIDKVESNRCQYCHDEQGDLAPPETVNHFIFECPAHAEARAELIEKIGIIHFHLPDLMADTDRMKALTTFINRSRRLGA